LTNNPISKGEQLNLVMLYNWQLRWNQYCDNSAFAVKFGGRLFQTRELLEKLITDEDAKTLMIKLGEAI